MSSLIDRRRNASLAAAAAEGDVPEAEAVKLVPTDREI